jgi:hypothetical protein
LVVEVVAGVVVGTVGRVADQGTVVDAGVDVGAPEGAGAVEVAGAVSAPRMRGETTANMSAAKIDFARCGIQPRSESPAISPTYLTVSTRRCFIGLKSEGNYGDIE